MTTNTSLLRYGHRRKLAHVEFSQIVAGPRIGLNDVVMAAHDQDWREVTAATIGRAIQTLQKESRGRHGFCVISAWRHRDRDTGRLVPRSWNLSATAALVRELSAFGCVPVDSRWIDEMDGDQVIEPAFVVAGLPLERLRTLVARYDQDCALYAGPETGGRAALLTECGDRDLGDWRQLTADRVANAYSGIKGRGFALTAAEESPVSAGWMVASLDRTLDRT